MALMNILSIYGVSDTCLRPAWLSVISPVSTVQFICPKQHFISYTQLHFLVFTPCILVGPPGALGSQPSHYLKSLQLEPIKLLDGTWRLPPVPWWGGVPVAKVVPAPGRYPGPATAAITFRCPPRCVTSPFPVTAGRWGLHGMGSPHPCPVLHCLLWPACPSPFSPSLIL